MADLSNPQARLEGDYQPIPSESDKEWLQISKDAYTESESFLDVALRAQWERNLANFQSRHPSGSKYHTPGYKFRSKAFRPKTRAMARNNEAAVAAAFFSTQDTITIQSEDQSNVDKRIAASLINECANYRLNNTMPWFITVTGAFQDTCKYGVCISHQRWAYEECPREVRISERDETGKLIERTETESEIVQDTPVIELRPPENIRISPSASWVDPVNTSPYLIDIIPMYLQDVREMIKNPQGVESRVKWRKLKDQEMMVGHDDRHDTTRRDNQGGRPDPKSGYYTQAKDHELVWVHRNIFRREQRDWIWYTVGTEVLLSDPAPLERVYPHLRKRIRPYVMSFTVLDTHKTHPPALSELTQGLQSIANDISNQRLDNVRLAMNKRYIVKRGIDIDFRGLSQSVPGGIIQASDPERDIRELETPEVTQSAYEEQDRINVDFDELAGEFSVSSVQSNRSLNETVGGMQMMQAGSSQIKEYMIKTFSETWVRPVMQQMAWMIAAYETDESIIKIAGDKLGLSYVPEELFMQAGDMAINVNVGMGATNPQQRIERFMLGLNAMAAIMPDLPMILNREEVVTEVFGALGYQDGSRFFNFDQPPPPNPEQQALEAEMQMEQAKLEQEGALQQQEMAQEQQFEQQRLEMELAAEQERLQMEREKMAMQMQLAREQAAANTQIKAEQARIQAKQQAKQASKPKK